MSGPFDVIIVGLGAMGSAAAFHLVKRGRSVLGLDQFAPPHSFGSSHGQTRIIREAYFEHPIYVPIVRRAYELWDELGREANTRLFVQTGGLMLGSPDGVLVKGTKRSAQTHGLPYETLSAREIRNRFPALCPTEKMVGIFEPRAGILFPEECISAHLGLARKHGAILNLPETVVSWKSVGDGVRVLTSRGEYMAGQLVLSAGSWITSLVPELNLPFTVERQVLFWFGSSDRACFKPERCPIHLWEYVPGKFFYGFPDLANGVKVARHHQGEITSPDKVRREVAVEEVEAMQKLAQPHLPKLDGPLVSAVVCLYTNTPDEHFFIDQHPGCPRVWIVSPCSGHGFKFSSAIGEIVCDLIQGERPRFDLSLFRNRRFV